MRKSYDEIKPGDVFRTEYGDYGCFVEIIFDSQEIQYKDDIPRWLKTIGYYENGKIFEGYEPIYYGRIPDYDVIKEAE